MGMAIKETVLLSDGAAWIANMAEEMFRFRRVSVSLIGGDDITLLFLFIAKGSVQFRFHKFLQDILKAVP